ncbi:MAG: DUF3459 domain-containing protein [Candidatus Cloacimonetes bacterium]|nr:DUF3459 domain-containing protein [Candidatus Cloacimonadota bacterium]
MPNIRFTYQAPTAGKHEVGIAGDFSSWDILDLQDLGGLYAIILPLEAGRYRYKLIVDGVWMADPANPLREPDPFGGENSVLMVETAQAQPLSWLQVYHDLDLLAQRLERYFDIIKTGAESYELRIDWYPGIDCEVHLLLDEAQHECYRLGLTDHKEVYHCIFGHPEDTFLVALRFKHQDEELFYGAHGFVKMRQDLAPITIHADRLPIFAVPKWVQEGIIYQIFPERFCNGDPSLNPDFSEWYYQDSNTPPPAGKLLPKNVEYFHFVDDWYDTAGLRQSPWQKEGTPDWWSFYGGDLPGIISKLDYLGELGVNILYFNPLWRAKSNHKYDAADYKSIDPHFGDEKLMKELCDKAHERGMKIIVDVAFNHTGEAFWAFVDCIQRGQDSPWWKWYDWHQWPLPQPLPPDFDPKEYYQCWWGIKDMPDLNFDLSRTHPAENYVRDIRKAVVNQSLVDYILDSVSWWLVDIGIDGFRLDVPDEVPYWFWQLFRHHVKSIKPDAWLVGEIWHNAQGWVDGRYFDSVMNYAAFKDPVLEFFVLQIIDDAEFKERITQGLARYPAHATKAMMNLLGSHDTQRIATLAQDKMDRLRLALVFQMCFIGTPHIYYGDEILMQGAADPDNRRPFNWKWASDKEAVWHRDFLIRLINLRKSHPLLQNGEFQWLESPVDVIAFSRYDSQSQMQVWLNLSDAEYAFNTPHSMKLLLAQRDVKVLDGEIMLGKASACVLVSHDEGRI